MRAAPCCSGNERTFSANQHLLSATGTRGIITYCHDEFAVITNNSARLGHQLKSTASALHTLVERFNS